MLAMAMWLALPEREWLTLPARDRFALLGCAGLEVPTRLLVEPLREPVEMGGGRGGGVSLAFGPVAVAGRLCSEARLLFGPVAVGGRLLRETLLLIEPLLLAFWRDEERGGRAVLLVEWVRLCSMCFVRSASLPGCLVHWIAVEKYLGIIRANSGRMAGRQAHTIPTLASTMDSVAWSLLSYVMSFELASVSSE